MPTVAERPTLAETQAVGLTLLHQFARHRGIDDGLIREAEAREHLDTLACGMVDEESLEAEGSRTESMADCSSTSTLHETSSVSMFSNLSNGNDTTIRNAANDTQNVTEERFHSIAESSSETGANGTRLDADRTLYHSMHNGPDSSRASALDARAQANPSLNAYGRELRRMAEDFEKSRLRKTVQQRAKNVKLSDITKESFIGLLEELFKEEITREKIVILFFFCTDVAIEALSFGSELVSKLLGWSFSYIINTVCSFVYKLGGWDKVLFYQFPSMLISCCAALAAFSLLVYLRKNLLSR